MVHQLTKHIKNNSGALLDNYRTYRLASWKEVGRRVEEEHRYALEKSTTHCLLQRDMCSMWPGLLLAQWQHSWHKVSGSKMKQRLGRHSYAAVFL